MNRIIRDSTNLVSVNTDIRALIDALHALWVAKQAGSAYPAKHDFDLPELAPWLRNLEIVHVERDGTGHVRYRYGFVGTAINAIDGMSITGRYADEVFSDILDGVVRDYDRALETGAPVERFYEEMANSRGFMRTYCKLALPLADDGVTIDALLVLLLEVDHL